MFLCWSAKGGSGTTVIAAALALVLSQRSATTVVDLAGDLPAALGIAEPAGPGVRDWMASPTGDAAALERLRVPVSDTLQLLPLGSAPATNERWADLANALAHHTVVVDGGTGTPPAELLAVADHNLLVTRPCYLALRLAAASGVQPSGIVLVGEPGRALSARDIERAVGAPVIAELHYDPAVARAVDAGLLAARLPASLAHALTRALKRAA
ncbi:MAG: hypothetical protein K8R99_05375 [Actinomycetia bacterium]|nr:hypothetical protein [Actinomycetes bacterium]